MSRSRLTAYLPYQLGDYLLQRAALPVVLVLLTVGLPLYTMRTPPAFWATPQGHDAALQLFKSAVTLFLPVGAFLAVSNVISVDRQQGYGRFYFSKPVSVLGFYGQTYVLHGVSFIALFAIITLIFGSVTTPMPIVGAIEAAALTFVVIAPLSMVFGALSRFDSGALVVTYLLASLTQQIVAQAKTVGPAALEALPKFLAPIAAILPPVQDLSAQRDLLYAGQALDASALGHIVGYSAGALVLGVLLLRRLPLSR
jgi:hypothetical protein